MSHPLEFVYQSTPEELEEARKQRIRKTALYAGVALANAIVASRSKGIMHKVTKSGAMASGLAAWHHSSHAMLYGGHEAGMPSSQEDETSDEK